MPHNVSVYDESWSVGQRHFKSGPLKDNKFKSFRLVGVEWEYNENYTKSNHLKTWARKWYGGNHYDGSCGWEAVTAPIAGDNIEKCLTELNSALTRQGETADSRCSVHVHVNVKDFEWDDIERLIKVYSKVELLLYAIGGDARVVNEYCSPCGEKYLKAMKTRTKESVLRIMFQPRHFITRSRRTMFRGQGTASDHAQRAEKHDGGRYKGLNLIPWLVAKRDNKKDCTVEFRIHENTMDAKRVIGWVQMLVRFVDWVKKATPEMVKALPKNQLMALLKICPGSKDYITERVAAWSKYTTTNRIGVDEKGKFFVKKAAKKTTPEDHYEDYTQTTVIPAWTVSFSGNNTGGVNTELFTTQVNL